jgi:hypothetical protein
MGHPAASPLSAPCWAAPARVQLYRHIVLAVRDAPSGRWGALGISRRPELMFKPLEHASLAGLVAEFIQAYSVWGHAVQKVRVGLPAPHDAASPENVCWR